MSIFAKVGGGAHGYHEDSDVDIQGGRAQLRAGNPIDQGRPLPPPSRWRDVNVVSWICHIRDLPLFRSHQGRHVILPCEIPPACGKSSAGVLFFGRVVIRARCVLYGMGCEGLP